MPRGKGCDEQTRKMIYNVYRFMLNEAENGVQNVKQVQERTSKATGVCLRTISRIIQNERKSQFTPHRPLKSCGSETKTVLVILADGAEGMEAVIGVDMLRRGGITVTLAGLDGSRPVTCSRNICICPDKSLSEALGETPQYDAVILPGGKECAERLSKSSLVGTLLQDHESDRLLGAMGDAPAAFVVHGVAVEKTLTSHPDSKDKIPVEDGRYIYVEGARFIVDGNIVTSRGPGTAYWFCLKVIELLIGAEKADAVRNEMLISGY